MALGFIILGWLEKLTNLCNASTLSPPFQVPATAALSYHHAERCLQLYRKVNVALGPYHLVKMAHMQLLMIVLMFTGISYIMLNSCTTWSWIFGLGCISSSLCALCDILVTCVMGEECHQSLVSIIQPLEAVKNIMEDAGDKEGMRRVHDLISQINNAGPLTAKGFFNIEKQTVVSMMGSTATYLIVLIQFKLAERVENT